METANKDTVLRARVGRGVAVVIAGLFLAACQPAIPDSSVVYVDTGRGVGFDPAPTTLRVENTGAVQVPNAASVDAQVLPSQAASGPRAINDPQGLDAELANGPVVTGNPGERQVLNASPSNAAPVLLNNPGISDENDFDAVSSRRSIESDAARRAQRQQQYQVVQPTAVPTRTQVGPNIVQYALNTTHARGVRVYQRFSLVSAARFQRNCAVYNSSDEAQIDFLSNGGPARDRRGLDPDGDGFACDWDPAPFRRAAAFN